MTAPSPTRVWFLVLPQVHLLDLGGPAQAFDEASRLGGAYEVAFVGTGPTARSAQGLLLADLAPLPRVHPEDRVLVPGLDSERLAGIPAQAVKWLGAASAAGARIGSICSGAFVLARAGLLDDRDCTTHWKVADRLLREHPRARVRRDRLFVRDGGLITSAGVASGIDMSLSLIEEDHGPLLAARVAREMVVYLRRDGSSRQESIYLDYRTHLHPGIHRVQDWLVAHPERNPSLHELGRIAGMSSRNLTRQFRRATGITLKEFSTRLRLEVAEGLLHSPELTLDGIAARCGYRDPRQLRRLWKRHFGVAPSRWQASEKMVS